MATPHSTIGRDDTRPPLFTPEEWRSIVASLMLSPRQAETVGLVMQSKTDKEIASALGIGKRTVRTHLEESKPGWPRSTAWDWPAACSRRSAA